MIHDIGSNQSVIQETVSSSYETIYQRRKTLKWQNLVIFGRYGSFGASVWVQQGSSAFFSILSSFAALDEGS